MSLLSFTIYNLKIMTIVVTKERRNSFLTIQCLHFGSVLLFLSMYHFIYALCHLFLWISSNRPSTIHIFHSRSPAVCNNALPSCHLIPLVHLVHSILRSVPFLTVGVSLSNSGLLSNLIWSVLKIWGNIRPISASTDLQLISLLCFLPCQKSKYNKDE